MRPDSGDIGAPQSVEFRAPARYGFRVATLGILIGQRQASEVLEQPDIYPVPNTPGWLRGLVNLRGNLVPVFDLAELLGLEREEDTASVKPMLLVVGKGEEALGLIIEGFPRAIDLSRPLAETPPLPDRLRDFHRGTYLDDSVVWLDIDLARFVGSLSADMGT
ncbi:MAG: chemotaxis protein CheW [Gammaproteobacteria bacterium]|nr:chemotaxis protein CheW [Gammaproteobacteria bacterium]NIR85933.1 chemotaxis protein CheW [Gammaproteobacteria bacterium]NIR91925.1 chemotaxis protein CheW [Gammaproteobacteria bacterium]NIU07182.1 chemotaxis protein CheW [Gammaproteobacteria bacterium]NIV53995.1 hypothetical protein [Gammaproteobacteria bacterium]